MTAVHNKFSETSVLAELKETIRKQAIEIEKLKKSQIVEQTSISPHTATSTAHGGGPIDDGATYMTKSFLQVAYQRVGWLSLFLVSLSFTAIIVNGFEHTLSRQIELAFFMPLLAGHGGNTGGQSVGTILSALSSHDLSLRDAPKVILKEACSGLTVGIFLGTILAFISYFFMGISIHVSTCLCCTLPLISLIASTLGSTIPFLCVMMNLDPSVIAAPAMTSFVDVTGLLSYFLIANQVFRLFGLEL
jgi:Mg/Co/Ni transporter MgtE